MVHSTLCKIVTAKNFIFNLCTHDIVGEVSCHANFGFNGYSGGFSPNMRNITTLWLFRLTCSVLSLSFFSRFYAQVKPLDRFSRFVARSINQSIKRDISSGLNKKCISRTTIRANDVFPRTDGPFGGEEPIGSAGGKRRNWLVESESKSRVDLWDSRRTS